LIPYFYSSLHTTRFCYFLVESENKRNPKNIDGASSTDDRKGSADCSDALALRDKHVLNNSPELILTSPKTISKSSATCFRDFPSSYIDSENRIEEEFADEKENNDNHQNSVAKKTYQSVDNVTTLNEDYSLNKKDDSLLALSPTPSNMSSGSTNSLSSNASVKHTKFHKKKKCKVQANKQGKKRTPTQHQIVSNPQSFPIENNRIDDGWVGSQSTKSDRATCLEDINVSKDNERVENEDKNMPMYGKSNHQNFDSILLQLSRTDDVIIKPLKLPSVSSEPNILCRDDKQKNVPILQTSNSPNTFSRSNSLNYTSSSSSDNRRRFSNKLGHKKSKR